MTFYRRYGKRTLDATGAAVALALLWPVVLLVALAVRYALGKPVLFCQRRPGLGERSFSVLKFRTMLAETERDGRELTDAERVTKFGLFLRATSLDELPQLWNILRGDMSFIGPRPLLERYIPYYRESERVRHDVRPGLTGWAQVNGRNDVDWDERLALDAWYVGHLSFALDARIFIRTILAVACRRGVRENPAHVLEALDEQRRSNIHCAA